MSEPWRVAGVQMDCRLGAVAENRAAVESRLADAAGQGARLVVFPECVLTGYGLPGRDAALAVAEAIPGPSTDALAAACRRLGVFAVVGMLERDGDGLFNSAVLLGPDGLVGAYRKLHLPCLGVDRFADPGDRPLTVHDLGGLKVGVNICFDGSFPEVSRVLTLLGADLIVLPTNWADAARRMAMLIPRARAFENHVYYLAVNRVGTESGFHYLGLSSASDFLGDHAAFADHDREEMLLMDVDPAAARAKKVVQCAGEYEIDRVNWRRPEFYAALAEPLAVPFAGHNAGRRS